MNRERSDTDLYKIQLKCFTAYFLLQENVQKSNDSFLIVQHIKV